jgi:hypothetical protein
METNILLCDFAENIAGKLYIMGGGWDMCSPGPRNLSVVVRVLVPWSEANVDHSLALRLQDDAGNTVEIGEPPRPVVIEAQFQVGRPPGTPQGWDLNYTAVFTFNGLFLEPNKIYRWQVEIDGEPTQSAVFRTAPQPSGTPQT